MLPVFVYGTLKPGQINYSAFLKGSTLRERPASIAGAALYTAGTYPYLVIGSGIARPYEQAHGMVMTLHPDWYHEVLRRLDWLEGYTPGNPHSEYQRVPHPVQTASGTVRAWVYTASTRILAQIRRGRLVKVAGGAWPEAQPEAREARKEGRHGRD